MEHAVSRLQFATLCVVAVGWGVLAWQARSLVLAMGALFFLLIPFILVDTYGWAPRAPAAPRSTPLRRDTTWLPTVATFLAIAGPPALAWLLLAIFRATR
jgi:hypothetical protein